MELSRQAILQDEGIHMIRMFWQRMLPSFLQSGISPRFAALFPRICLLCRAQVEPEYLASGLLCRSCQTDLPLNQTACRCCAEPLTGITNGQVLSEDQDSVDLLCARCQKQSPAYERVVAPYLYRYPMSEIIRQFKTRDHLLLNRLLADLLSVHVLERLEAGAINPPDLILPVPTHWRTRLRRGFNPAACLADAVGRQLTLPVEMDLLRKQILTKPQHDLNRAQRLKNLDQSFGLRDSERIKGRSVALVDDVVTTASTADVIAALLRDNGAHSVQVWALARTPYQRR